MAKSTFLHAIPARDPLHLEARRECDDARGQLAEGGAARAPAAVFDDRQALRMASGPLGEAGREVGVHGSHW